MSAGIEPIRWPPSRKSSETRETGQSATLAWLDSLASGSCTPEAFLIAMRDQFRGDGEEGWEVLSLLDQYYRRGKIKADVFQTVKSRLESSAIRGEDDVPLKAPAAVRPRSITAFAAPAAAASPKKTAPAPRAAFREVSVGDLLGGRYRIRALLAEGATGNIFEALDEYRLALPASGQRVAVKVLHPRVTQREELLFELQKGFQQLQLLSHPNVMRVHEFERDGDTAFFTMELLTGAPLNGLLTIRNGTGLPRPYALALMRDVGAALSHAHARGVVHGDLSPQNIFITNEGDVRVLDFGASNRILRDRWTADLELSDPAPMPPPCYASCQILEGQHPDVRDDIFAFACVAYAALSGRHPFPGRTALDARAQRARLRRPPGITGRQWRVLREGLRWERDRRPSDVQKWLDRFDVEGAAPRLPLLPVLVNAPPPRSPSGWLTTALVTLLALGAAAGFWAVADYESFAHHMIGWSTEARSSLDGTAATPPPTSAAPAAASPAATAPAATTPAATTPAVTAPGAISLIAPSPAISPSKAVNTAPPATGRDTTSPPMMAAPAIRTPAPARANSSAIRTSGGESAARANNAPGASAGAVRLEMAADTVEVPPTETAAHVIVRRRGNTRGEAAFTWWTESGTAKPGQDFAAVTPRRERIEDGSAGVNLSIPVTGLPRAQPKSFYVVIDRADGGAGVGDRTLTMVTLQPAE